jgi:hypothetical protein
MASLNFLNETFGEGKMKECIEYVERLKENVLERSKMDNNLKVLDLYNNSDNKRVDNFNKNVHSEYKIESEYEKVEVNFDWLDLMEDTVRYIDNILRNP